jgi:hypothetical protein
MDTPDLAWERTRNPTGFAHSPENTGKTAEELSGAAKSGAVDARLAIVLDAWPWLPDDAKAAILALVQQFLDSKPSLAPP